MATLDPSEHQVSEGIARVAVEDTDPSVPSEKIDKYPIQVTDNSASIKDLSEQHATTVNLECLIAKTWTTRQAEENESPHIKGECLSEEDMKDSKSRKYCLETTCRKPWLTSTCITPPCIGDMMNDEDLLYTLRLKLDPHHPTIKNWRNFASKWGMTYDELCFLEQKQQSPTLEFLLKNSDRTVTQLIDLCKFYRRMDVLKVLEAWVEKEWPKQWQTK